MLSNCPNNEDDCVRDCPPMPLTGVGNCDVFHAGKGSRGSMAEGGGSVMPICPTQCECSGSVTPTVGLNGPSFWANFAISFIVYTKLYFMQNCLKKKLFLRLPVGGAWLFTVILERFGVAQNIGFETHEAISIFEGLNVTQYTYLSLPSWQ